MHQNSQANLKRVQSLKFLNIVKQTQLQGLSSFFTHAFLTSIFKQLNRLSNAVYINDKKINEELFAEVFSNYYKPSLCSYNDLIAFYKGIKEVFKGEYKYQNELFDLNKDIFLSKFDSQSLENYLTQISVLGEEIRLGSIGSYQEMIIKFNYCFMIYYLCKQKFADQFYQNYRIFVKKEEKNHFSNEYLQIYLIFMKKEIIQIVLRQIRQRHYEDEAYKSLLFVCDASLTFSQIFVYFMQSSCFEKDSWDIFLGSLNRFCRQEDSKFSGVSLIAFLNVLMRLKPDFISHILAYLVQDDNNQTLIQKSQKLIQNISYTRQFIEFYAFLLKGNRNQIIGPNMVIEIQFYAVKVLNSNQTILFCPSILLINETIKYNVENDAIMIILQALQANDPQIYISALKVVETALSVNHTQLMETLFIRRTKYFPIFMKLISGSIDQHFSCHCLVLQILYLMVRPDFYPCFNDIMKCLEVTLQINQLFSTFLSEILKKMCLIISEDEVYARKMSPELILNLLQRLISTSTCQDICCQKVLQINQKFVNRQVIENTLQVLILFFQNDWFSKKVQKDTILHENIYNLYMKFGAFVTLAETQTAVIQLLKQQMVISPKFFHKKIYGVIFVICEYIVFLLSQTLNNVKVSMKNLRESFFRLYNQYFTVQQLNLERIPIYIDYKISFVLFKQEFVKRFLPMNINYQTFQKYCIEILQFTIQKQKFHHPIQSYSFKDVQYRMNIRDENTFRDMLNRYISKKTFAIQVFIQIEFVGNNTYEAFPVTQINPFNTSSSSFQSLRGSPRERISQNLTRSRGNSRSPIRVNAVSRIIPNSNSRISQQTTNISPNQTTIFSNISRIVPNQMNQMGQCEACRQPSYQRLCDRCNRR